MLCVVEYVVLLFNLMNEMFFLNESKNNGIYENCGGCERVLKKKN
mgnify:CR=1 FL=1